MSNSTDPSKIGSPLNKVIDQLKQMIIDGELNPDNKLPPERKLAEKLGVGRMTIRDAIKKLEFYGIVKTHPQSGTQVKGMGLIALEGLFTDALNIGETDYASLVDTRIILEIESAGRAAARRTDKDIELIQKALNDYESKVKKNLPAEEEDAQLHLEIANVSGNSVLKLLLRIITPDIVKKYTNQSPNSESRNQITLDEHKEIVSQIINQNAKGASRAMRNHLRYNQGTSLY